ncbi:hypothetical protein TWF730_007356 [Orbilia blumenaviensis]|uniref:Uncharacterized protein n=1 Tax=Orbilia blumenaviensis TaxID=1796055 RepID=A0AAV9V7U8_9PEZI
MDSMSKRQFGERSDELPIYTRREIARAQAARGKEASGHSDITPGVRQARKVEQKPNPELLRLTESKAQELRKKRLEGSTLTRIPVYTSLDKKEPFEVVMPEPTEPPKPKWAEIAAIDVPKQPGARRPGRFEYQRGNIENVFETGERSLIIEKSRKGAYAFAQLYCYIVYWFATWFGASIGRPGKWRDFAFRFPPTEGGWDFFNIREEFENLTHSNAIYTKKKVWFNPSTGRYETILFTNLDDESRFRDRYPGETDGIDPIEFAKYHYLNPEETAVKLVGERVFKPFITVFVAFLAFLVIVNGAKIGISVLHLLVMENPEVACLLFGLTFAIWVVRIVYRWLFHVK